MAGRIRYRYWVMMLAPSGGVAETGSHLSFTPKIRMKNTAHTNSGMTAADNPPMVMMRSIGRPRRRAAKTPPKMLAGTTSKKANAASLSDFGIASPSFSVTGTS